MASDPKPATRTTSLSRRLRRLSIHLPGRGPDRQQHQEPPPPPHRGDAGAGVGLFRITHTPDRPGRRVEPSEAPSEEECRAEIAAWQRQAQAQAQAEGRALARVGDVARERRRGRWLSGGVAQLGVEGGGVEGSSGSEYEDVVVVDDDEEEEEEGAGYISFSLPLASISQDHRSETHGSGGGGSVGTTQQSKASYFPPHGGGSSSMGGIRSPRRGTLLSVSSVGASAGYLSDGDESYHGEVAEAEEVDVQRLYRLEAARRGYCLICKAHTVGMGEISCTKCGTNFDYTSGEEGLNYYGARDRPLLHAELPESSPPSRRSHHRRSPRLAPPPLPSDASYPKTRLATPKPQTQPRRSAPADQNDAVSEEGAPPITAVLVPSRLYDLS